MSTITREHLRTKTTPQLAALFAETQKGLASTRKSRAEHTHAKRLISMIAAEWASRPPML